MKLPCRFFTLLMVAALLAPAARVSAAGPHDLFMCATVSRNYVIGSKLITDSGLYRRDEAGAYQHFGINFPFVLQVAFDPRDRNVCYAVSINGVLDSTDGGNRWRIGNSWDMTEPKDVSIDPNAPDHIYLGLPDGIALSTDRGATWVRRESGLPERGKYTQTVEVDRTQAGRVLAGCEVGIFLTEDGARSWRRVLPTTETVLDIQQSPHDAELWIATTQAEGVLQSRDGGRSWQKIAALPAAEAFYNVAFDARDPRRVAVASWTYGVHTSEDGGATWTARNAGLPAEHCAFRTGIDPDTGRLYASIYRDALFVSDDFGRTWRNDGMPGSTIYSFVFTPRAAK